GGETGFHSSFNWIIDTYRGEIVVKYVNAVNLVFNWQSAASENLFRVNTLAESWEIPTVLGLGASPSDNGFVCVFHYWHCIVLAVLCGAAPWLRYRFSLRTLLIATMLLAVLLGVLVVLRR